jgi:cytochrome P450
MSLPIPKAPGLPGIGNALEYRRRKIHFLCSLRDDGNSLTAFRLGRHPIVLLKRPEDVIHVELKNAKNYAKATMLRDLVGDGILMSEGEKWRKQRRLIQPRFHPGSVALLEGIMNRRISDFLKSLDSATGGGPAVIDLGTALKKLVFGIILETLFGEVDEGGFEELSEPMEAVNFFLTFRFNELLPLPLHLPFPRYLQFRKSKRRIDEVIHRYIGRKQEEVARGKPGQDLLTQMILARDSDTGAGMDPVQLRDEAVSILLAGFETTGNLLSWLIFTLARSPETLERLRGEIDSRVKGEEIPGAELVLGLPFLSAVFDETLRLHPPVWAWTKRALGADVVGGYEIERGQILFLSPYLIHRDPGLWKDPDVFDPGRWNAGMRESLKGAFFPFGIGPRTCVGRHFAILEAKLILVHFLRRFEFQLQEENQGKPDFKITLGLSSPLRVLIEKRRERP